MPIIITTHIANMNAKCAADHGAYSGVIVADMSYPVASHTVYASDSAVMAIRAMTTKRRSRRSAASKAAGKIS
jgi:hypothetical protein